MAACFALVAVLVRRELPSAQRLVSCTTSAPPDGTRCMAWDRTTGDVRRVRCEDAQQTLGELLDVGALSAPAIGVVTTVVPVGPKVVPVPFHTIERRPSAVFAEPPWTSASDEVVAAAWNGIDRSLDGTATPGAARALLAVCADAPVAEREARTLALTIVPRDARASLAVAVLGALTLLLLLARRTRIDVDAAAGELRILERVGPLGGRESVVRTSDVLDVAVEPVPWGILAGRRVVLRLRDGTTLPLVRGAGAAPSGQHEKVQSELREALGLS